MNGGQYGQDTIDGMELFFDHWTNARPLVFVKYESLHENLDQIGEAFGVSLKGFPKRRERKSRLPEVMDERLLVLCKRIEALPEFYVAANGSDTGVSAY